MIWIVGWRRVVAAAIAAILAGCSSPGTSESPPSGTTAWSMTLTPSDPQPGASFEASFDPLNHRGGYFTLQQWDGDGWSDPSFVLESDANRPSPVVENLSEVEMEVLDYGVSGTGPDGLVMPEAIEPGHWLLCTANAGDHACAQFVVDPAIPTTTSAP